MGEPLAAIPSVPKALGIASEQQVTEAKQMQELFTQLGTNLAESKANVGNLPIGKDLDTPQTILYRDTEQLKADKQKSDAHVAAGYNADTAVNVFDIMLRDIRDSGMKMRQMSEDLAKDKAVSLFDDPILAIANAFTIPWKEQELEGMAELQKNRVTTLTDLTHGVTNVAATAESVKGKIDAAGIIDRQRALSAMAAQEARDYETKAIEGNIRGVQAAMTATRDQLNLAMQYNQYKNTEESMAYQRKQHAMILEEHRMKLDAIKDQKVSEELMLGYANKALAQDGLPQFANIGQFKSRMNMTAKEKDRIGDLINRGMLISDGLFVPHGTSPQDIIKYQESNGYRADTPDKQYYVNLVHKAAAESQSAKTKDGKELKGEDVIKKLVDELEVVGKDDNANPMRAPAFETMAASEIGKSPIFQKVITPWMATGDGKQSAHPNIVGNLVAKAVANREISPNQGADFLSQFYKQSINITNQDTQIEKLTGRLQSKFISRIDSGVDMTSAGIGLGIMAGGIAAIPFSGPIGVGGTITGAAMAGTAAFSKQKDYNFADPVDTQAFIVRKVFSNMQSAQSLGMDKLAPKATKVTK